MNPTLKLALMTLGAVSLSACAASQGGMLEQSPIRTFTSTKAPGRVASCVQQSLRNGPTMGTDGTNYWVTRQSQMGVVVRYDFKPANGGTLVEYRSRLRINNGLNKVQACL